MRVEVVNIESVRKNPTNPRIIKNNKFELLKQSISDFPAMLHLREIVVDSDYMILGGNMRYEALKDLGYKQITVKVADNLTDEQKQEFIIKDNSNFGEWDYDELANNWNLDDLTNWGLDLPTIDEEPPENLKLSFVVKFNDVNELASIKSKMGMVGNKKKYSDFNEMLNDFKEAN